MNHQPQGQQQGNSSSGTNGGTGTAGTAALPQHQQFPPGGFHQPLAPQQLMGLMSNPALAAAAAASHPLFPPSAVLSNPGAFLAMQPEAFGVTMQQQQQQTPMQHAPNSNPFASAPASSSGQSSQQQQQAVLSLPPVASKSYADDVANHHKRPPQQQPPTTTSTAELTPAERAKQNRDRNREHARSTRLRKKAYVQKLKELVEGLHAERSEQVRARRVAVQHLAEKQQVRRGVVRSFLQFHCEFETEEKKWKTILEEDFWLKQPVTPYRSFRRAEIEKESRVSRGIAGMICDAASMAVMMESIGSRSPRWMQIKREEFTALEEVKRAPANKMPRCIARQESRLKHAISSLSSSGDSSNHGSDNNMASATLPEPGTRVGPKTSSPEIADDNNHTNKPLSSVAAAVSAPSSNNDEAAKVSGGSGSGSDSSQAKQSSSSNNNAEHPDASKDYHDYHAKPLPDPKLSYEQSSNGGSPSEDSNGSANGEDGKRAISGDSSSSGDDSAGPPATKRARKAEGAAAAADSTVAEEKAASITGSCTGSSCLPPNIAKKGGIAHSIRPQSVGNGAVRLRVAPAVVLPPFAGIGKKSSTTDGSVTSRGASDVASLKSGPTGTAKRSARAMQGVPKVASVIVQADMDTSSSNEDSYTHPQITGAYHLNEDDMILMEDFLMCPFVFRTSDAVLCGACSECVMPGMLRAKFSTRNKLQSMELVYDAMGFMQQLERASGNEGTAQIIAGSLEMALDPLTSEARVITLAKAPYLIVNVNEVWTRITGYTQMEVEGKEYLKLLHGEGTVPEAMERPGKPVHKLEEVAKGHPACSTNIHYDRNGRDFIEFVSSYPLSNANDEITHILHVSKELPSLIQ